MLKKCSYRYYDILISIPLVMLHTWGLGPVKLVMLHPWGLGSVPLVKLHTWELGQLQRFAINHLLMMLLVHDGQFTDK